MLPGETVAVPASLMTLLAVFSPLFTVPSFRVFCGLRVPSAAGQADGVPDAGRRGAVDQQLSQASTPAPQRQHSTLQ